MLLLTTFFDHFYVVNFLRNENFQFSDTKLFQQYSYFKDSWWLAKFVTSSVVVSFNCDLIGKSLESFVWFKNLFEFTYADSMEVALSSILLTYWLSWPFSTNETLTRVFSCEFCKISKNNFFTEHILATASVPENTRNPRKVFLEGTIGNMS